MTTPRACFPEPTTPTVEHALSTIVSLLAELAADEWLAEQTQETDQ